MNCYFVKFFVFCFFLVYICFFYFFVDLLVYFVFDDEIGCVSVVVYFLELCSELFCFCEYFFVLCVLFCYIVVYRVGEVKGKGDVIVVDVVVENDYVGFFVFVKVVDLEGFDIDGGNFNVVNVGEDGEFDGVVLGVLFYEVGVIFLWG